jgi:iron(III) transport system ATP-binding protein
VITVQSLVKTYGGGRRAPAAVDDISFVVPAGQVVTLLGASGCGKTTTLRCVAGLVTPDSGRIRLGEREVYNSRSRLNVSPDRRRLGMVFQSYAIWPHLTVRENVAFPLRRRGTSRSEGNRRAAEALELVGLGHLADRLAPNLSGGQQQRVAFARAIVAEPEVLLLDEPLSNLDAKLRDDMRTELRSLQRRLGLTMCFVTHDQVEAMALADTVVLMREGRIVESGPPRQLYDRPRDPYTATFLGASNLWRSTCLGADREEVRLRNEFGTFRVPRPDWYQGHERELSLFFRRHNVRLREPAARGDPGTATGRVTGLVFLGDSLQLAVAQGGQAATLAVNPWDAGTVSVGDEICFTPLHALTFPAGAPPAPGDPAPSGDPAPPGATGRRAASQPAAA